jgi:PucR C-terminal helix-turn-helix domain
VSAIADQTRVNRILERVDIDVLVDGVLDSFFERDEFRETRPPREEMRSFVRWNLDLVMRWIVQGQPPTEAELDLVRDLARALGAAGMPLDTVPANYRRGARFAWQAVVAVVDEDDREAVVTGTDVLFEYVDRITSVFVAAYEEGASGAPALQQQKAAQALLERLTTGTDLIAEDHELAESIGCELAALRRAFVVRSRRRSAQQHGVLAQRLRARGVLAVAQGRRIVGLTARPVAWEALDLGSDAIIAEGELGPAAIPRDVLEELRLVVEIASEHRRTGVVCADHFPLELLMRRSPSVAARIHAQVYGPLSEELAHTLDVLVEHEFDRGRAAAALPAHRNTMHNRLVRIGELSGTDVDGVLGRPLVTLAWLQRRSVRQASLAVAPVWRTESGADWAGLPPAADSTAR